MRVRISLRKDGNRVATVEITETKDAIINKLLDTIRAELAKIPIETATQ